MKIQEFLEHHGIAGNPFAEEDAQNDTVFKRTCLETTFHPSWDKIYGDPADPSTSIVFGEKGSGKTALKLQMVRQFERHNASQAAGRTFVVLYDDFNPFLDRFVSRVGPSRPVEKVLSQWKLWDHMDAILSLAVTQLVDAMIDPASPSSRSAAKLTGPQSRDLALLAACYDQSTGETFPSRWQKLRRRVGYCAWLGLWPLALGLIATLMLVAALAVGISRESLDWAKAWWPWLIVAAAWGPWVLRRVRAWWTALKIVRNMRTGNRTVGQLARAISRMPEVDLAGQPLPTVARSDDRYELLAKLQAILAAQGYAGMVVIVDRLDEPHLINGSADRMKQVMWPMLDNKFLKSPGIGFKLLLPIELYRFIEREDEQFNQRARLDKQNLVPSLEWSGETLYDIASTRVKAASACEPAATLSQLFEPEVDQRRLLDGLRSLRVPRQLFKFLYRLLVAHCHAHTGEQPVYRIPLERFDTVLAVFRRDQDAFDRGLAPR
ncbi:MAG: hypothetical protein DWI23_03090 [Planctomycetota bacterium]|jgi:hypothetical protein|nr:MAG: hypothetical protein DWI23_03090 [Planctomycetota bacterium]